MELHGLLQGKFYFSFYFFYGYKYLEGKIIFDTAFL
jgi:hypothetical protein